MIWGKEKACTLFIIFLVDLTVLWNILLGKTMETDKKKPKKEWPIDKITHDIRDYMPLLHKQRKIEDPTLIRQENLKTLRRITRKLYVWLWLSFNFFVFSPFLNIVSKKAFLKKIRHSTYFTFLSFGVIQVDNAYQNLDLVLTFKIRFIIL